MQIQKEYKINTDITLKLENGITNIYLNGKKFIQCSHIMVSSSLNDFSETKIDSIDDLEQFHNEFQGEVDLDPMEEFWGHCSNIQAWVENGFDSRLLHSNLSFPLLKELSNVNPRKYDVIFREEICQRMIEGNYKTLMFLYEEGYVDRLTREEFWSVFDFNVRPLMEIERKINENSEESVYFEYNRDAEIVGKILPGTRGKNSAGFLMDNKCIISVSFFEIDSLDDAILPFILEKLQAYPSIDALEISGCKKIHKIPKEIAGLKNLKWLYLENNNIISLPKKVHQLKKLEELRLEKNNLTTLPIGFSYLDSLKYLDLSDNSIEVLDEKIFNLKKIDIIFLRNNLISKIPQDFANLKTLSRIDLRGNTLNKNKAFYILKKIQKLKNIQQ
ncbi:MAG: leucine-rich repeat domain-containing protein [Promethearchaeota archaeon]